MSQEYDVTYEGNGRFRVGPAGDGCGLALLVVFGLIVLFIIFGPIGCVADAIEEANKSEFQKCYAGSTFTGRSDRYEEDTYDVYGNLYEDAVVYDQDSNGYHNDEYTLDGQYTKLSGVVFVPQKRDEPVEGYGDEYRLQIYGDGVLLYTSPNMTLDTQPQSFSINVAGVETLHIMCDIPDFYLVWYNESIGLGNVRLE